jgi:hypothetical protein
MATDLQWTYERDECWGPDGEPLLSARLLGAELLLTVRNSRRFGVEVVVGVVGSNDLHGDAEAPVFKVSFDDQALHPLPARVQDSRRLAFVADVRTMLAELNCTNQLRLHARPDGGGVWLQLDATTDDLQLDRLVEPASQVLLVYPRPDRQVATRPPARGVPAPAHAAAQQAGPSAVSDLVNAVAPLAGLVIGAKLGRSMFGPGRRD